MGLIILSSVDKRAETCRHLGHSHIKVLPKRIGSQTGNIHVLFRVQDTLLLSRQVDACLFSKAKLFLITGKVFHSQILTDLHQRHVAGILNGLLQSLSPVAVPVVTVDIVISHMKHSAAVISLISRQFPQLQTCRNGKRLKCRSRLIYLIDAEIIPKCIQGL